MLVRALIVVVILVAALRQAHADDRSENCGYVYRVEGYVADIGGLHIALPANDHLVANGRVLAEHATFDKGSAPQPWHDSANVAEVALARDYVLVRTMWTDCIDFIWSRIYVLDRSGTLIATSPLWSMHDESSFSLDAAGLMFSSPWLCGEHSGAPEGRAFVYVLRDGSAAFEREERAWNDVCIVEPRRSIVPIYFARMRPILPEE